MQAKKIGRVSEVQVEDIYWKVKLPLSNIFRFPSQNFLYSPSIQAKSVSSYDVLIEISKLNIFFKKLRTKD